MSGNAANGAAGRGRQPGVQNNNNLDQLTEYRRSIGSNTSNTRSNSPTSSQIPRVQRSAAVACNERLHDTFHRRRNNNSDSVRNLADSGQVQSQIDADQASLDMEQALSNLVVSGNSNTGAQNQQSTGDVQTMGFRRVESSNSVNNTSISHGQADTQVTVCQPNLNVSTSSRLSNGQTSRAPSALDHMIGDPRSILFTDGSRTNPEPNNRPIVEDDSDSDLEAEVIREISQRSRELGIDNSRVIPQRINTEEVPIGNLPAFRNLREADPPPAYVRDEPPPPYSVGPPPMYTQTNTQAVAGVNVNTRVAPSATNAQQREWRTYDFRPVQQSVEYQLVRVQNRQPNGSLEAYVDESIPSFRDNCELISNRVENVEAYLSQTRGDLGDVHNTLNQVTQQQLSALREVGQTWRTRHDQLRDQLTTAQGNHGENLTQTMNNVANLANELKAEREARIREAGLMQVMNQRIVDLENRLARLTRNDEERSRSQPRTHASNMSNIPENIAQPPDARQFGMTQLTKC
ncbi:putative mediator of RNA polymerase II transcription subunit 29 [Planococcus citri]|uniref:putative mediator of RNA polymerase II transcription subunit 29 n=1 Tax=Planococcus citri TaxID=170843 RepID=UPI0031F80987